MTFSDYYFRFHYHQENSVINGGFKKGRAAPPLSDGLTPSLTVGLYCRYVTTVLYYGDIIASLSLQARKTWYSQNIKIDCHRWLFDSFRVHQIRFPRGFASDPADVAYSAPPDLSAGFRGLLLKD